MLNSPIGRSKLLQQQNGMVARALAFQNLLRLVQEGWAVTVKAGLEKGAFKYHCTINHSGKLEHFIIGSEEELLIFLDRTWK